MLILQSVFTDFMDTLDYIESVAIELIESFSWNLLETLNLLSLISGANLFKSLQLVTNCDKFLLFNVDLILVERDCHIAANGAFEIRLHWLFTRILVSPISTGVILYLERGFIWS